MSNRKTLEERIEAAKLEADQKANNLKKLIQEQKAAERKARNHRLCKRGGIVEKLLPGLPFLTDEQFDTFVHKVLLTPHTTRIMSELAPPDTADADSGTGKAQGGGDSVKIPTEAATETVTTPADKPTGTPQGNGANSNSNRVTPERAAV